MNLKRLVEVSVSSQDAVVGFCSTNRATNYLCCLNELHPFTTLIFANIFLSLSTPQHTGLKGSIDLLLEEADIDKDGRISLSEFRRLLRTASMSSRSVTPRGNPSSRKLFN